MSLNFISGDILTTNDWCLVVPVNCQKAMGKGLALQVKNKWPEVYLSYTKADIQPGDYHVYWFQQSFKPAPYVLFLLPTKREWKNSSQYYWVAFGLMNLAYFLREWEIDSVSIPPLGCGLGGLKWVNVKQIIEDWYLGCKRDLLKNCVVNVYGE